LAAVGVVGATGLVGETMIKVLQDRSFPMDSFHPFASGRSEGKNVRCHGRDYPVEIITPKTISKGMILFGATSANIAKYWVPMCRDAGAVVIDNSSAYRMDSSVPLVVPEVNARAMTGHESLIANPNCSTIQLVVALNPLLALGSIRWISVATYQAVSGAGTPSLDELEKQQSGSPPSSAGGRIHQNIITSIGDPGQGGFCGEELKLMRETCKIMGIDVPVYASTARVPVRTGHTEAVAVAFDRPLDPGDAAALLRSAPGVIVSEYGAGPVDVEGIDEVVVDRIRVNPADSSVLQFWVLADNLRKGAALNAVQIAEEYLKMSS
jgi:aspartate-semialdehyde dehydrogenase